jgi:DNA replication protein DnaC
MQLPPPEGAGVSPTYHADWVASVKRRGVFGVPVWSRAVYRSAFSWAPASEISAKNSNPDFHWVNGVGGSVYIEGPAGCGKSALAAAMLLDRMATGPGMVRVDRETGMPWPEGKFAPLGRTAMAVPTSRTGFMVTEDDLFVALRGRRMHGDTWESDEIQRAESVGILVLDDVGSTSNWKEWMTDVIQRVVMKRYDAKRPMILTSNLRLDELGRRYGDRTASRLVEMVGMRRLAMTQPAAPWRS